MYWQELIDRGAEGDRDGEGVNELTGVFAYAFGAKDGAVAGGIYFHVAVFGFHEDGFSVVVEGVVGREVVDAAFF